MSGRPPAKLELVATGGGNKDKTKFGTVWRSNYPGSYRVSLSLPHPTEKNGAGYPVEDDVVAIKTRSGAKYVVDREKGFFLNLNVYEAMEERPPFDGGGSPRGGGGSTQDDESFDEIPF